MKNSRMKIHNEYAAEFPNYSAIPKAVFSAIAFSFAMRLNEDDPARALQMCFDEWEALNLNGVIPQMPQRAFIVCPECGRTVRKRKEKIWPHAVNQAPPYGDLCPGSNRRVKRMGKQAQV